MELVHTAPCCPWTERLTRELLSRRLHSQSIYWRSSKIVWANTFGVRELWSGRIWHGRKAWTERSFLEWKDESSGVNRAQPSMLGSMDRWTTFCELWEPVGFRQGSDVVSLSRVPTLPSIRAFLLCYLMQLSPQTWSQDSVNTASHKNVTGVPGMSACSERMCEEG